MSAGTTLILDGITQRYGSALAVDTVRRVIIGGQAVALLPPNRRTVGIVFQNYALFPHMSVAKNVGYGLRVRGVPRREIAARVEEALALVKLSGFADRSPRQLSRPRRTSPSRFARATKSARYAAPAGCPTGIPIACGISMKCPGSSRTSGWAAA